MSLLSKIKSAASGKIGDALNKVTGGLLSSGSSKSSAKDYSNGFEVVVKIGDKEIKNSETLITQVMVDSGTPPEAGICEIGISTPAHRFCTEDKIQLSEEFTQIKIGQPLEIQVASTFHSGKPTNLSTVFKGFVEKAEYGVGENEFFNVTIYGMDAKMWMMANKLTESRGTGKSYEQIIKSVINNYRSQANIGKVSLFKDVKIKNTFYQVDQSDHEFLCMLAELTGSFFYVGADGEINFCAPSKLGGTKNKINFKDDVVENIKFSASVWGTPQTVQVTAIDPSNPSKTIAATSSQVSSIGSGKASKQVVPQNFSSKSKGTRYVNITDNSIENREQAQARANAEYNRRNLNFVETMLCTKGNPKLGVGQSVILDGFGKPFDNEYLVTRVVHECGIFNEDNMYTTKMYMVANKFKPQGS